MVSFGDENSLIDTFTDPSLTDENGQSNGVQVKGLVYTVNSWGNLGPLYCDDSATLTSCSGSLYAVTDFVANGDTSAVVTANAANVLTTIAHGTSATNTPSALKRSTDLILSCSGSVIWTQVLAHAFHLGYGGASGQCPTDSYANARTYAAYGAKADDVVQQINSHLGELGKGTLVTVMAGQWDVYEQYQQIKAGSLTQDAAVLALKARAERLATAILSLTNTGAKVVVALTPDLGESPMAYNDQQTAVLKALTLAFNNALYIDNLAGRVKGGGRMVAGVNPELMTDTNTRSPSYTYAPAVLCPAAETSGVLLRDPLNRPVLSTDPGYDALKAVKFCSTASSYTTLAGSTSAYMWADTVHFSPLGHGLIGALAYSRASNQF